MRRHSSCAHSPKRDFSRSVEGSIRWRRETSSAHDGLAYCWAEGYRPLKYLRPETIDRFYLERWMCFVTVDVRSIMFEVSPVFSRVSIECEDCWDLYQMLGYKTKSNPASVIDSLVIGRILDGLRSLQKVGVILSP